VWIRKKAVHKETNNPRTREEKKRIKLEIVMKEPIAIPGRGCTVSVALMPLTAPSLIVYVTTLPTGESFPNSLAKHSRLAIILKEWLLLIPILKVIK